VGAGGLVGHVGSAFVSSATGGGNETTLQSFHTTLVHHGMVVVGLPYAFPKTMDISEVRGGGPLGAGALAGPKGERLASQKELTAARFQGAHVARIAQKLKARRPPIFKRRADHDREAPFFRARPV
jgi:NAD(P)H dehydrogenase (quinone)